MNHHFSKRKRLICQSAAACLGSVLIGALGSGGAIAKPTLSNLLDTVPVRPTVAQPSVAQPAIEEPNLEPTVQNPSEQPVRLVLRLGERRVLVYRGDTEEASYPVAIGRPGWETPTGSFSVFSQVVDPGWTHPFTGEEMPPGPNNPLGDRWIAFWTDGNNSIGFHGTPNRESVGQAASHGCVRMYNEDVKKLYDIVAIGTPVVVEP
ncbi:MAG: L,D-transpeptidase [Phormidesmis sp.]